MQTSSVSTGQTCRLLIAFRTRALWNAVNSFGRRGRDGAVPKGAAGGILGVFTAVFFILGTAGYMWAVSTSINLSAKLDAFNPDPVFTALVGLLTLSAALIEGNKQQWSETDFEMRWFSALPVSLPALLMAKIGARASVNPFAVLGLWSAFTSLAVGSHGFFGACLTGLCVSVPLLLCIGAFQVFCDTGLRVLVKPSVLRNVEAMAQVLGTLFLFGAMSVTGKPEFMKWCAQHAPPVMEYTAFGASVKLARGTGGPLDLAAYLTQTALFFSVILAALALALRLGVDNHGVRESARHDASRRSVKTWLNAVARREVLLLRRDRTYLVQTCVTPPLLLAFQMLNQSTDFVYNAPANLAAAGFAAGAYALTFSALQIISLEGQSLWLLHTVPRSLTYMMRKKALMWGCVATAFCLAFTFAVGYKNPENLARATGLLALSVAALPVYALLATAMGVLAADPNARSATRKVHAGYMNLYIGAVGVFIYALESDSTWNRAVTLTLLAVLSLAFWQKAREHLPYLLDKTASPPPRVSVIDGLGAALMFLIVQVIILVACAKFDTASSHLKAFVGAGAVVWGTFRFFQWRSDTQDVPRLVGSLDELGRAALLGIATGSLGMAYVFFMERSASFGELMREADAEVTFHPAWIILTVVAAPLFEEFIFRGLLVTGLRRITSPALATVLSAAIFAMVHPPLSVAPVFVLGCATAWIFQRRKGALLPPMLVHAVYNAMVLALPMWRST